MITRSSVGGQCSNAEPDHTNSNGLFGLGSLQVLNGESGARCGAVVGGGLALEFWVGALKAVQNHTVHQTLDRCIETTIVRFIDTKSAVEITARNDVVVERGLVLLVSVIGNDANTCTCTRKE